MKPKLLLLALGRALAGTGATADEKHDKVVFSAENVGGTLTVTSIEAK